MKPKFKDFYKYVMTVENQVIRFKTERTTLEIIDPDGKIFAFINLLDGTRDAEEIASQIDLSLREVEEGIAMLDQHRMLESEVYDPSGLTEREQLRYKNNFTYFSLYESMTQSRFDYQKKLKNCTVAVLGLGAGSVIAAWLAAMGVGKIIGVDYDRVELNNLNRQFFYTEDDVGEYKTVALQRRLNALNRDVQVEVVQREIASAKSLLDIIDGADVVISAIDTPPLKATRYVNSACLHLKIPSFYIGIGNALGFYYRVLPFESGCADCRLIHIMRTEPEQIDRTRQKLNDVVPDIDFGNPGFAPNIAIITSLIASEVAKYLTNYGPMSELPFGIIDFRKMENTHRDLPKYPECPSCGKQSVKGNYEPVDFEEIFSAAEAGRDTNFQGTAGHL